tara:strand:- start:5739 stop:7055 length:1317 start_codon:yes stop_codon:yes gene_type:complete
MINSGKIMTGFDPETMIGGLGRAQSRTLALIRWVAIAGQTATLVVVHYGFGFKVVIGPALLVVAASALANSLFISRTSRSGAGEPTVAGFFAFDLIQLSALLYLTGGLENPFAFLLLAPVVVSAAILSFVSVILIGGLATVAITLIAIWHEPLPWNNHFPPFPPTYILGVWVSLAIGVLFFAFYTFRVAEEARQLSEALYATQMALAREQQLSAMGMLAAAAAHELGSPLGTIAVAAGEISRELPEGSPLAEDIGLLVSETHRCRDILAALAQRPEGDAVAFSQVPLSAVVEHSASMHKTDDVKIVFNLHPYNNKENIEPKIRSAPEIIHGFGNLTHNAVQFAVKEVNIETRWDENVASVTIRDDGPGFSQIVLDRIGEPYISDGRKGTGHMGLGIFIAKTLLERTGARLIFGNCDNGGAEVSVVWPLQAFRNLGSEI